MGIRKGIILAGGTGSRLRPLTNCTNKHLLPINNKFIIDYPINTLKKIGCEHITIVLGGEHFDQVAAYLKDGADHGVVFNFVFQGPPRGISEAINRCQPYVENEDNWAVCLGDNIFEKPITFPSQNGNRSSAKIVLHNHQELQRFGVASLRDGKIVKIAEKPTTIDAALDNYAITGCYVFNRDYFDYFKKTKQSARGEFEITDIIEQYIANDDLEYSIIDGNWNWSDAGTFQSIDAVRQFEKTYPVEF